MGARGPQPTPTKLLEARGSQVAKQRADEPKLSILRRAVCPRRLKGEARKIFNRTSKQLMAMSLLTEADLDALADYSAARAEFLLLDDHVQNNLEKLRDSPNYPVCVALRDRANERARKLAEKFGLTPADRTRLRVEKVTDTGDPMEKLLRVHTN